MSEQKNTKCKSLLEPSKTYIKGKAHDIEVGMKEIKIGFNNKSFFIYDTSGPYSDKNEITNIENGLKRIREPWILKREEIKEIRPELKKENKNLKEEFKKTYFFRKAKKNLSATQMYYAKKDIITEEMEYVSIRENCNIETSLENFPELTLNVEKNKKITPEFVKDEIKKGRAIIPSNINHPELEPMIIGSNFLVKINANIGKSALASSPTMEVNKAISAITWGADTVMDLSTGKGTKEIREWIIRNSPVPIGTVPLYETLEKVNGKAEDLNWEIFKETLIEQAEQGVDYFTIHAGLLKEYLVFAKNRLCNIVSRGGSLISKWMSYHNKENFLYTHFDKICDILRAYDVSISLGDGLRPGATYDANDKAQFSELKTLGELTKKAWAKDVQVMIEGPGHIPIHLIEENVLKEIKNCHSAPFYTLGPLPTDIAAGHDHIASAIGGAIIASKGCSMLCYVTPKEHLGLPEKEDVREGIMSHKIASHAANLAKGHPASILRDNIMSQARINFNWEDQYNISLDPETARKYGTESGKYANNSNYCSMCGPDFCAMKISKEASDLIEKRET